MLVFICSDDQQKIMNNYGSSNFDEDAFFQFTYDADRGQMAFLQTLSRTAYQNVTYHCKNSVAYYDAREKSYDSSAVFMTSDDHEMTALSKRFTYSVSLDECQVSLHIH